MSATHPSPMRNAFSFWILFALYSPPFSAYRHSVPDTEFRNKTGCRIRSGMTYESPLVAGGVYLNRSSESQQSGGG